SRSPRATSARARLSAGEAESLTRPSGSSAFARRIIGCSSRGIEVASAASPGYRTPVSESSHEARVSSPASSQVRTSTSPGPPSACPAGGKVFASERGAATGASPGHEELMPEPSTPWEIARGERANAGSSRHGGVRDPRARRRSLEGARPGGQQRAQYDEGD